jgi:aminoglycoside phosphotransferase family enzyme
MQNSDPDVPSGTETGETAPAAPERAVRYRERARQAQIVAAQATRARAAGGQPSNDDAARLVAEFHARGGQVTVCPPADGMEAMAERERSKPEEQTSG